MCHSPINNINDGFSTLSVTFGTLRPAGAEITGRVVAAFSQEVGLTARIVAVSKGGLRLFSSLLVKTVINVKVGH